MTVRGFLMWVHLVLGVTGALFLVAAGVSGAYITFQAPLERWLNPVPAMPEFTGNADIAAVLRNVEAQFAPRRVASVDVRARQAAVIRLRDRTTVFADPRQGTIIGSRPIRFASLENLTLVMRRLHLSLLLGPKGRLLVAVATLEAFLLALTGLWLWWRKKQWRLGKLRGSMFRVSWDLHSATGIWFLVPVLSMSITGLLFLVPEPVYRLAGATPAEWRSSPSVDPGDSTQVRPTVASILHVADSALVGETVRLELPFAANNVYAVEKEQATVFVHQFKGTVVEVRPARVPTAGDRAIRLVDDVHTGKVLGPLGQAVMTLGSLMLALMAVTGLILGWKRLQILAGKMSD